MRRARVNSFKTEPPYNRVIYYVEEEKRFGPFKWWSEVDGTRGENERLVISCYKRNKEPLPKVKYL